jgi:hypothetical protein
VEAKGHYFWDRTYFLFDFKNAIFTNTPSQDSNDDPLNLISKI